jgi:hypothetical protein
MRYEKFDYLSRYNYKMRVLKKESSEVLSILAPSDETTMYLN